MIEEKFGHVGIGVRFAFFDYLADSDHQRHFIADPVAEIASMVCFVAPSDRHSGGNSVGVGELFPSAAVDLFDNAGDSSMAMYL